MNIFNLFVPFWQDSEREPFSTTEAALYHYLLYEANRNHWVMPVRCSTTIICFCLSTTRQNIQKARDALKARGYIDYKAGIGKRKPAEYTLLRLSDQLPDALSDQLPYYNIKDKDETINISSSRTKESELLPLSSLREILQSDADWQKSVVSLISGLGKKIVQADLPHYLEQFFQTLSVKGVTQKSDQDCRTHFYNWLCKQTVNFENTGHDKYSNPRRGVDVPTPSEQNYEGAF